MLDYRNKFYSSFSPITYKLRKEIICIFVETKVRNKMEMPFRRGGLAVSISQLFAKQMELPTNGPISLTCTQHLLTPGIRLESVALFR